MIHFAVSLSTFILNECAWSYVVRLNCVRSVGRGSACERRLSLWPMPYASLACDMTSASEVAVAAWGALQVLYAFAFAFALRDDLHHCNVFVFGMCQLLVCSKSSKTFPNFNKFCTRFHIICFMSLFVKTKCHVKLNDVFILVVTPSQRPSFEHASLNCYTLLSPSITFHCFTLSLKPTFSENLILHLSLFLSVVLISWL